MRLSISLLLIVASAALAGPDKPEARPLYTSGLIKGSAITPVQADLKGTREIYLVVTDGGDNFTADWANWIEPVVILGDGKKIPLSTLTPKHAKVGWGKLQVDMNADGKPMKVAGKTMRGLGTHAPSLIVYDLPEGAVRFEATVALDDGGTSQGDSSSVVFQVYAQAPDGKTVARAQEPGTGAPEKPLGYAAAKAVLAGDAIVAKGLEATLFAAEPQIQNPTNIDTDHRGRVWAVEAVNYRSTFRAWGKLRAEGDRVVILEDSDGDGAADKEATFWQSTELQAPLGLCVLPQERGTKVIVSAAPNIWLLTDADGDDKAELAQKILTVGGNWDHDHEVHAFVFGPDGKFYFNFGNEGKELKDPEGKTIVDLAGNAVKADGKPYRQGMVFRCDVDLATGRVSNVETLGHNFRNNYEVCVDSFGTMWQSDNDDDGNRGVRMNYVMEFGNYGFSDEVTGASWQTPRTNIEKEIPLRHWHLNDPGVVPNLLQTGSGSPTGLLFNEGTLLGPQFTNQIIHCDAGPRIVRAYPTELDGAGYKATMLPLLESRDQWYRPADVSMAPDGSLLVADWYDPGVGGHNMGDHKAQSIRGRIYRVAPPGHRSTVPTLDLATAVGCVEALKSPNNATRYAAWTRLHKMGAAAESELTKLWASENPRLRARALGLLAQIPGRETAHFTAAFADRDADVRVAAIRLCYTMAKSGNFSTEDLKNTAGLVERLVQDPDPRVRRQLLVSLSGAKRNEKMWAALAQQHDGKDRWYLEAMGIGARGNEDACFDTWLAAVGDKWNTPAGRDIIWRLRGGKAPDYLTKVLTDKDAPAADHGRFLRAFDFLPASPAKSRALVLLASAEPGIAGEALDRLRTVNLEENAEVKQVVFAQLASAKGTGRFVDLVRDFKLKDQSTGLLAMAVKEPSSPAGIEAARMLLEPANVTVATNALKTADAARLVEALGNTGDARVVPLLTPLMVEAANDNGLRKQAVRSLVQNPAGVEAILTAAQAGTFPQDLRFAATVALTSVQMPKYKARITELFPAPSSLGATPLPPIAELVKRTGNISRGRELFAKEELSCVTCHRAGQVGLDFGPALTEIGSKLAKEALYESIIEPNAGVSNGFETTMLTLKNGDGAAGIIRSETDAEVILATPRGIQNRYAKGDVAKREKLPYSMMPSGLQQTLSTDDLVDMVEYLFSLKAAK